MEILLGRSFQLKGAHAATADKMYDLQFVAVFEARRRPIRAGNNLQIQFHRYAIGFHAQMVDQGRDRQAIRKIALFSVDLQFHKKKQIAIGYM